MEKVNWRKELMEFLLEETSDREVGSRGMGNELNSPAHLSHKFHPFPSDKRRSGIDLWVR